MNHQTHVMELVSVDANGVQEWCCRTCERRLRFHWSAATVPTVLEPGDADALHVGPQVEPSIMEHESGLSAVWLTAITDLDMTALVDSEGDRGLPL
jgi:hypothetical protein